MTSQPEPGQTDPAQARKITEPLRELAALTLVGANALLLLVGAINLLFAGSPGSTFTGRSSTGFFDFVGLAAIGLPLLAVLLATHVQPPVARAKQITTIALAEYAASVLFGVIAVLGWLIGSLIAVALGEVFTGLLVRAAYSGIFAVAAFAVYKLWRTLYYVPKPKPQSSVYGHAQPYGRPGYPPPGYPAGYAQGYGQPTGAPPTVYGQPTGATPGQQTAYGQPMYQSGFAGQPMTGGHPLGEPTQIVPTYGGPAPQSGPPAPASAPPAPASAPPAPASAPPAPASAPPAPASAPPAPMPQFPAPMSVFPAPASGVEPTQEISPGAGDPDGSERTQLIIPASRQPAAGSPPPATGDGPAQSPQR